MEKQIVKSSSTNTNAQTVKNVVLVHGAFADGSGYPSFAQQNQ